MKRHRIFISSVQKEFAEERRLLAEYIRKDALLGVFLPMARRSQGAVRAQSGRSRPGRIAWLC